MKLEKLRKLVADQYGQKHPERDELTDWLYEEHVLWVAQKTEELCKKYKADADIAVAAALVHDIADSVTKRSDEQHVEKSLEIGRDLCSQAGYSDGEISIIDDTCVNHSCRGEEKPSTAEGRIMAMADGMSHFVSDFYLVIFTITQRDDYEDRKAWMRKKLEKDFHKKMFYNDEKEEIRPLYETLKQICR